MKFYLSLLLFIAFLSVQAQDHFEGSITYQYKLKYLSEKDSIHTDSMLQVYGEEIKRMVLPPLKEVHLFKKDSLLIKEYFEQEKTPHIIHVVNPNEYKVLTMNSGKYYDRKDYNSSKYKNFKKYKRIAEEDEVICGYKCKAWKANTKRGWKKIWLADIGKNLPNLKELVVIFDNKLVLKEEKKSIEKKLKQNMQLKLKSFLILVLHL